jgi:hypothetical protein
LGNPLLRRSQTALPAENPYARFGLKENPFPDVPAIVPGGNDPRTNGTIYDASLRASESDRFERLLLPHIDSSEQRSMVFLMDDATRRGRGIGKTAFLNYQRCRIMQDLGEALTDGTFVLLAAHIIPEESGYTRKFWQLTRLIARTLNESSCIAWAIWRLRALSGLIPDHVLGKVDPYHPGSTLGDDQWLQNEGVNVFFALNHAIERQLKQVGIQEKNARTFAQSGCSPIAWEQQFFSQKNDYYWRQQGAQLVFDDMVRLFKTAGIHQTVLLVDDVEKIVGPQNAQERRVFVSDIRHFFVDGPFQSVYTRFYPLLLTIHPYIQEIWKPHWQSTGFDKHVPINGSLTEAFTIPFQPLQAETTAVPLVLTYLDYFRLSADFKGTLTPFDEEAVIEALRRSGGVPGLMLRLLRLVMERAIQQNWQTIRTEQVQAIFEAEVPTEQFVQEQPGMLPPTRTDLSGGEL